MLEKSFVVMVVLGVIVVVCLLRIWDEKENRAPFFSFGR